MSEDNLQEIDLQAGDKKLRIRGSDILGVAQLVVICLCAWVLYKHDAEAAEKNANIVQVIKEQTQVQRETLIAQREANCLNRLTPEQKKRVDEIEFCRNLGRGR